MPSAHTSQLGPGTEFDRIRRFWRVLGERAAPSGDDCAVLEVGGERIAITTDMSVEDVHFRIGWLRPHEVGRRAAASALSDLAAMAAAPLGVLVSLGVSPEWPDDFVADVMAGVGDAAGAVGATVLGGDLVRSERLVLDVTALGRAPSPVWRSGARVGDGLWVTGRLGGPAAAIEAWQAGREPEASARERFAFPTPRIAEAMWLRDRGARAMIDVSDGLAADAGHIAAASAVRCAVEAERVPVHAAAAAGRDVLALIGGEEYELLVAMPSDSPPELSLEFEQRFDLLLTRIGRIEEGQGVSVTSEGQSIDLPTGFRHF
jgi:thiamine-monophosphate kinase